MINLTHGEAQSLLHALDFHFDGDATDLELMGMLRSRLKQTTHASDCAVHNEPAYPAGECDCAWVKLTDEEAKKTFEAHNCTISADLAGILARAITAKLKEKNNG
jgi:hypothetical protein